jgi:hypothetical protein
MHGYGSKSSFIARNRGGSGRSRDKREFRRDPAESLAGRLWDSSAAIPATRAFQGHQREASQSLRRFAPGCTFLNSRVRGNDNGDGTGEGDGEPELDFRFRLPRE